MSRENILDEIHKLESRLNKYNQSQVGVSFEELNSQNFDFEHLHPNQLHKWQRR